MARPLRIEYPGAVYHVTSRGNGRTRIFRSDRDRLFFLDLLASVLDRFKWSCHGYCLMDNHYHLLIETNEATLSRGMRHLNGVYTQWWNRTYRKTGHLFQGRYKAILVDKDAYLLELSRYVVLNPVRARMAASPDKWKWSSYHALAGLSSTTWLTTDWVLDQFSTDRRRAHLLFKKFVAAGIGIKSVWDDLTGQVFLGDTGFIEATKPLQEKKGSTEVPRRQRYAARPALGDLFRDPPPSQTDRNRLVCAAHLDYGYTLKEIAGMLGLHYTTISKIITGKK